MKKEISFASEAGKLEERLRKITLVNSIISAGDTVRIATWKSQAKRDPKIIEDSLKKFDEIENYLNDLQIVTRMDINLKQIEETRAAALNYKQAMGNLLANWNRLQELNVNRAVVSARVTAAAAETAKAGIGHTTVISREASKALSMASNHHGHRVGRGLCGRRFSWPFSSPRSITKPIQRIIESLSTGADQVSAASSQVSSASQSLAEGASEQAAAVEETSSSLEEMSSMTKQNADNASQANSLMGETRNTVNRATGSMKKVTEAMDRISSLRSGN